jgi:hypothetical protein
MGYEVIYSYQEKTDSEFSGETKTFKKRVGDPYEDFPLDKLSGIICCQLARRDIYVKDVEIYEITKKKINFKETKNGIILKNKKSLFTENFEPVFNSEVEKNDSFSENKNENTSELSINQKEVVEKTLDINTSRVIKKMTFVPEPQQQIDLLKKGVKLTPDKSYNIYHAENHINGINEIYTLIDDKNKTVKVSDLYFVPMNSLDLENDGQSSNLSEDGLNWSGAIRDDPPQLRR